MSNIDSLPNGPTKNKLLRLIKFFRNPIAIFEDGRKYYGKTFTLRLPGLPNTVVISDLADLKQVFSASSKDLNTGKINALVVQLILGNYSLLTLDGEKHLQQRKLLLPPFHGLRMKSYGTLMSTIVKKKITGWNQGDNLKLVDEVRDMTFHIILSAIFGIDEHSSRFKILTSLLYQLIQVVSNPFAVITLLNPLLHRNLGPLTPWKKIMILLQQIDACLFEEITVRKQLNLESQVDILSILLQATDEVGNRMTDQEIRDEMLTLLLAGHDTSTMGISWALYGILANPEVYKKLKDELNYLAVNKHELVQHLDKLAYLDAVVKEALRITPVIPSVNRITNDNYQLGKYKLPKGTIIAPSLYLAHHDADYWSNPEIFMPERFLDTDAKPYTYLPFGSGIRRCIGSAFAQYEMKIIIAEIVLGSKLKLKEDYVPKRERHGLVISPSKGLPVIVEEKLH